MDDEGRSATWAAQITDAEYAAAAANRITEEAHQ
jgi:hypothetical protein